MKSTHIIRLLTLGLSVAVWAGCAHTVPSELADARAAYQRASESPAVQTVPAELHKAQMALAKAEKSFNNEPGSYHVRDLAYVAQRRSELAMALGSIATEQRSTEDAKQAYSAEQTEIVRETKAELTESQIELNRSQSALSQTHAALMAALAQLAAVKEEERGLVITLSGSVLFRTNDSALLPAAKARLDQVADALLTSPDRTLVVEGHTDSHGAASHNQELSLRRADSVRSYLVGRGYPAGNVVALGKGESVPTADNGTPEGRSNNRRVEIIIQPEGAFRVGSTE